MECLPYSITTASSLDERRRWIDGDDVVRTHSSDQLGRQGARPAAEWDRRRGAGRCRLHRVGVLSRRSLPRLPPPAALRRRDRGAGARPRRGLRRGSAAPPEGARRIRDRARDRGAARHRISGCRGRGHQPPAGVLVGRSQFRGRDPVRASLADPRSPWRSPSWSCSSCGQAGG